MVNHTRNNGRLSGISINGKAFISDIKLNASDEPIQYTLKPTAGAKNTDRTWFAPRRADGSWAGVTLDDAANLYSYDALSQITGITPTTSNASLVPYAFEYDADGRLKQSTLKPGETREAKATYTYDANGNRTQEKLEGTGGSQTTDTWMQDGTNRLSTHSKYGAYLYDNAGNNLYAKTLFGPMNHRYDAKKRLIETTIGGLKITHTYDALGQRISRTETVEGQTPKTTLYFYDDNGLLLGEYDDKGNPIQETIYLNNRPVAVVKQGQIYTIWADHLGTPRIITGPNTQTPVWTWDSTAFGQNPANETPNSGQAFKYNLRFPGQVYDEVTGLHYNYFRDYDPKLGRYIQNDPIGLNGGLNRYGYVGQSPLNASDSLGLLPDSLGMQCARNPQWCQDAGLEPPPSQFELPCFDPVDLGIDLALNALPGGGLIKPIKGAIKAGKKADKIKDGLPPLNLSPPGAGRRGAFREAKRRSGIPVSQQPKRRGPNYNDDGSKINPGSTYHFDNPVKGKPDIKIRDDSKGHNWGPNNPQNRGPHFNDDKKNHYDY